MLAGHLERIAHVSVSPDGKRVASASLDRTVRLWDPRSRTALAVLPRPAPPVWVDFSPDGQLIAVGEQQNSLLLWDVSSEQRGVSGSFTDFLFLPGGGHVAGGSAGVIGRWNREGLLLASIRQGAPVVDLALDTTGELLAALDSSGAVSLWDLKKYNLRSKFKTQIAAQGLLFLRDGSLLMRTGGALAIRDAVTGHLQRSLPPVGSVVESWHLAPEGKLLVMQVAPGRIARLDLIAGRMLPRVPLQASSLALSADGATLAVGSWRRRAG